jgi:hypothetical protein
MNQNLNFHLTSHRRVQSNFGAGWAAKNEQQLIRRIESKLREFDSKSVEKLMEGVKGKLKSIADTGVFI